MQLDFFGATDTVTGSKYLVREGNSRVLVDCGLFQGYKQLRLRNCSPPPVTPAHIDHSGYLPLLARQGLKGKVYCSPATLDLCSILLPDCGYLLEEEAEFLNRHKLSKHAPALPLYTRDDAQRCLKLFEPVAYRKAWQPTEGLNATLAPSATCRELLLSGSTMARAPSCFRATSAGPMIWCWPRPHPWTVRLPGEQPHGGQRHACLYAAHRRVAPDSSAMPGHGVHRADCAHAGRVAAAQCAARPRAHDFIGKGIRMKTDSQLKADVIDELVWGPAINAAGIDMMVKD